ncbi:multidrug effflux MFS transporter [Tenggerimyces flavus]|uniref:Multidrug effflux MFS transporter n=1 Tax=Tenggerimyces flavus TaxID=1708749 RepID=A0ABV7YDZ2_9ACTN|nr:multidrug effflux MFS transporter [Tenggerimyces flavus]MBM7787069.1 DHA1 family bicyclomycin/chloramphenicol resistance-like MFS transporter [Tenggerimyces flavus]
MRTPAGASGVPQLSGLVLLLGSIIAIGPMSIDLYLPAFPGLITSLETTEPMVQLTLTACLVGLASGQAVIGPLSDAIGRRRPLLAGMALYALASVACALAPTVEILTAGRFIQGVAAAAGTVISQALVRDLVEGPYVARVLSRLLLVMGLAPILAPTLGGQLLLVTGWRGLFWLLAGFGVLMTVVVAVFVKETLPVERRHQGGVADALRSYRSLLRDRRYVGYAALSMLGFVAIFAYVSGSPFAYQEVHQLSPQLFGLMFGINSVGLVAASQLNARLVLTVSPFRILLHAVPFMALAAVALLITTATGWFGLAGLTVPLFVLISSVGLVLPNAGALALNRHPESAGAAAALVGTIQFVVGAFAGPLIGVMANGTAVPMAVVIAIGAFGAVAVAGLLVLGDRRRGPSVPAARHESADQNPLPVEPVPLPHQPDGENSTTRHEAGAAD